MRAARVLDLLLVLQRHGRMTAGQLAEQLEVSERTVLRDVEALSEAGIPIYTSRGSGGGITLLDGFQTQLTGLTEPEAAALFLTGQPALAQRLGLTGAAGTARQKLLAGIPPALAEQAERIGTWFLHEPERAGRTGPPDADLQRLVRCIREGRWVELTFADQQEVTVSPFGLVLRAGDWSLVAGTDAEDRGPSAERAAGDLSVIDLDRLVATRGTSRRCTPPTGFDLTRFWARWAGWADSQPTEAR
jgi:predicted DNA-binding transcriptional regulator YafY